MSGLYTSQPFSRWKEALRDLERQLARDGVVLSERSTYVGSVEYADSPVTIYVIPKVSCPGLRLEEVGLVIPAGRDRDDELGYWSIRPWYANDDRTARPLGAAMSTHSTRIPAGTPQLWTSLKKDLRKGGGVMFVFTASGTPSKLDSVSVFAVLRRGA